LRIISQHFAWTVSQVIQQGFLYTWIYVKIDKDWKGGGGLVDPLSWRFSKRPTEQEKRKFTPTGRLPDEHKACPADILTH
jgi:hypothetical protein